MPIAFWTSKHLYFKWTTFPGFRRKKLIVFSPTNQTLYFILLIRYTYRVIDAVQLHSAEELSKLSCKDISQLVGDLEGKRLYTQLSIEKYGDFWQVGVLVKMDCDTCFVRNQQNKFLNVLYLDVLYWWMYRFNIWSCLSCSGVSLTRWSEHS